MLYRIRVRAVRCHSALGRRAGVNARYINRLERGVRRVPTAEVALALAADLALAPAGTDRLLWSAGCLPACRAPLPAGDSTILAVARLLSDRRLSPEARAEFRARVEAMAQRGRGGPRSSG